MGEKGSRSTGHPQRSDPAPKQRLLGEAVERHWPDLLVSARVYIRQFDLALEPSAVAALAEEALQDAVITALRSSEKYDPRRPARAWLRGIVFNEVRHRLRARRYERSRAVPVAKTPPVAEAARQLDHGALSEDEMFDLLLARSRTARRPEGQPEEELSLKALLDLVGPGDQEVLLAAFVDGLIGKALAARLGIAEGAAWARLSRAITRLREAYVRDEREFGGTR